MCNLTTVERIVQYLVEVLAVNPQALQCQTLDYLDVTHTLVCFPQKGFLQDAPIVIDGQDVSLTYLLMVVA
ncbi:hypothetical protein [Xylanibacter brevis]|uniref:hypothetical protein n=1 Tax=Xylanibacter brevis TaxID=83231 RepID=UPI002658000D|nr:hypothetical protein [Xylanibacter brevis]